MAAILNFGSIFKKSLAHPHVARNVMVVTVNIYKTAKSYTKILNTRSSRSCCQKNAIKHIFNAKMYTEHFIFPISLSE